MKRTILFITIVCSVFTSGCAGLTRESICSGIESSSLSLTNPLMIGCIATDIVAFGAKVASDLKGNSSSMTLLLPEERIE